MTAANRNDFGPALVSSSSFWKQVLSWERSLFSVDAMADKDNAKDNFLYPRSKYWGEFSPQNLAFNANLQEFAQRISVICNLETGGKLSPDQAYQDIKALWKELKESKKNLIDAEPPTPDLGDGDPPGE